MISIRPVLALSIAGALVLTACGGSDEAATQDSVALNATINVGRTTDPVSQLLAEIYGQGLENAGYRIGRKDPVADENTAFEALQADSIQFLPEFTGSVLSYLTAQGFTPTAPAATDVPATDVPATDVPATDVPATDPASSDPLSTDTVTTDSVPADSSGTEAQLTAIRSVLPASLTVTDPAGVDNGSVIACNTAAIDKFNLSTISDLVAATDLKLAGSSDFESAPTGGLAALNTTYGATLTLTDVPDVEPAIVAGTVDCGVLPSLTAGIIVDGLIMLQDDKFFAESDELIGLMTSAAGQADVLSIVDAINAKLTTDVIRSLLVKVQENRGQYDVVAKEFLTSVSTDQ